MLNKYSKKIGLLLFAFAALNFNGCILDAFDTLTQGFPLSVNVNISDPTGVLTSLQRSETVNLDDSDFYINNQSKINKIELTKIAYRTNTVIPSNISGNINFTLKKADGTVLFSKNIPNAQAASYIDTPYEFNLTQAEIQLVNAYIGTLSNRTLTATVQVDNVVPVGQAKTLNGVVDVVFEMEYEL